MSRINPLPRLFCMNVRIRGTILFLLTAVAIFVGAWAYFWPMNWHETFPGFGRHWLPPLGPYNQHLAKDVGAMYLALGTLSLYTLTQFRDLRLTRLTGTIWTVFNVLHLVYHLQHLHMYSPTDKVLNVLTLTLLALAGLLLAFRPSTSHPVTTSG